MSRFLRLWLDFPIPTTPSMSSNTRFECQIISPKITLSRQIFDKQTLSCEKIPVMFYNSVTACATAESILLLFGFVPSPRKWEWSWTEAKQEIINHVYRSFYNSVPFVAIIIRVRIFKANAFLTISKRIKTHFSLLGAL